MHSIKDYTRKQLQDNIRNLRKIGQEIPCKLSGNKEHLFNAFENWIVRRCENIVAEDVKYNVSELIGYLAVNDENFWECIKEMAPYDYDAMEEELENHDCVIVEDDGYLGVERVDPDRWQDLEVLDCEYTDRNELLTDFMNHDDFGLDIEDYRDEPLEYWVVSDWLARKLESYDYGVANDIHGLTVWGRCCSGMAIKYDYVIRCIAMDLFEKEITFVR